MQKKQSTDTILTEIKLQINQELYKKGKITQEMYEAAKTRIVSATYPQADLA